MLAVNFVKSEVSKKDPLSTPSSQESTLEDVEIIEKSLSFVNELLRNMLDMHRASNDQLSLSFQPTDVLSDVLEPVDSMLYRRGSTVRVTVECPDNLVVLTDPLRLKQVILNLGRNSSKFVASDGFIKLRACVVNGTVRLYVEDDGPGIPESKRDRLFCKFQESLDSLRQGTGVGLFLCKSLINLMQGELRLDESYDSGVEGRPGSRFAIDLCVPPMNYNDEEGQEQQMGSHPHQQSSSKSVAIEDPVTGDVTARAAVAVSSEAKCEEPQQPPGADLPENLTVLFVDDDMILRKLFSRSVRRVAPTWKVREASSGETALKLVESGETFDLIFMDQYMTSVEKSLLGSETVSALRSLGVECHICGVSANDVADQFKQAGANEFMMKPFPSQPQLLSAELVRILSSYHP